MRRIIALMTIAFAAACGSVDDAPLGGPFGGTTDNTDPNGGQDPNNPDPGSDGGTTNPGTDSGTKNPGKDSGTQQQDSGTQQQDSGGPPPPTAPTWSQIFSSYMGGSMGRCSQCHSQSSSAKNLYSWLSGKGYISGTKSALVDSNQSCLSWYGGNMPPSGPSSSKAVSDMNAWAAAGALNN